ncbi:MAG TPA: hypothetical protein VGX23_19430 [Actinocrinis sp.]|nr:hypothetical protein [Actinocrinis sp.]
MDEKRQAGYGAGRDTLRRVCERTVDLPAVGFRWVCTFTGAEARTVSGWLALAGRGAEGLRAVADRVAAAFAGICEGADVLVVDRYVESAVFLLDEVADSYPEHAHRVQPIAELLFTRLYSQVRAA